MSAPSKPKDKALPELDEVSKQVEKLHEISSKSQDAETALKENDELLKCLIDKSLAGVFLVQNNTFVHVNSRFAKMFGYLQDEIIGRLSPLDLAAKDSKSVVDEHIRSQIERNSKSVHYFFCGRRKDGVMVDCETLATRTTRQGSPAIIGTILDITKRKKLETALRQNRTRLKLMASVSSGMRMRVSVHERIKRTLNTIKTNFHDLWLIYATFDRDGKASVVHAIPPRSGSHFRLSRTPFALPGSYMRLLRKDQPIVVQDVPDDDRVANFAGLFSDGEICSTLQIPVGHFDKSKGVLCLFSEQQREWPTDEIEMLSEISDYLAITIKDARTQYARKVAIEKLKRREERLRKIIHNIPVMVIVFDRDGEIVVWNRECERVSGYTAEEVASSPGLFEQVWPGNKHHDRLLRESMEKGYDYFDWEWELTTKAGQVKTVAWSSVTRRFPISGWAYWGIGVDISERKRMENGLRSMAEGVAESTGESFFQSVVDQLARACEMEFAFIGEIVGPKFDRMKLAAFRGPPEMVEHLGRSLVNTPWQRLSGKKVVSYPNQATKAFPKDAFLKKVKIESVIGVPLQDSRGRTMAVLAAMDRGRLHSRDFALSMLRICAIRAAGELERLRTEAARYESEEQYRRVVQNANEAILIIQDGNIMFFNAATSKISGFEDDELMGRSFLGLVHPQDRLVVQDYLTEVRGEECATCIGSFRICKDNGEVRWLEASSVGLIWKGNPAILSFLSDITKRKMLQEELERAQRLESAGRVAAQIAHDFNNLLSPLAAYPYLMREELPPDSPLLDMLDEIENAADKLAEINQQLLTLGGRGHYTMESVDLNSLIHSILMSQDLPAGVKLKEKFESNLSPVKAGTSQLTGALGNLIMNAVEAMAGGGTLTVKTVTITIGEVTQGHRSAKPGDYVKLEISDTGAGIDPEILGSIFDPFFTTKTMDRKRGAGLGLSVAHGIIEDHDGYIDAHSRDGHGATFVVLLPATMPVSRKADKMARKMMGGSERILVVDDDPIQRKVAGQLLKRLGYQVHVVPSGEKAVRHIKTRPYDLLVMDMVMSGIDGVEAYRRILEHRPNQKAIILSGYAKSNRVAQAFKLGAGSFVSKPVTQQTLAEAVRRELDKKSKKRRNVSQSRSQ